MIEITQKSAADFISSYQTILKSPSDTPQFIRAIFLYSTALYIADLLDPVLYKEILNKYKRDLSEINCIGLQSRFIPHLLNYMGGKYHENHVRSFKSIVIKQYRHIVPAFDFYIDQTTVHTQLIKLLRSDVEQLFNTLIMAYYDDTLTLGELSLICGSIHNEISSRHPHISNASLILPLFYYNPDSALELRNKLFQCLKEHVLQFERISLDYDIDLDYQNCPHKGYRWINDVIADFGPYSPPFILKEMISHLKEGYVFGHPQSSSIEGYAGLYAKKR